MAGALDRTGPISVQFRRSGGSGTGRSATGWTAYRRFVLLILRWPAGGRDQALRVRLRKCRRAWLLCRRDVERPLDRPSPAVPEAAESHLREHIGHAGVGRPRTARHCRVVVITGRRSEARVGIDCGSSAVVRPCAPVGSRHHGALQRSCECLILGTGKYEALGSTTRWNRDSGVWS